MWHEEWCYRIYSLNYIELQVPSMVFKLSRATVACHIFASTRTRPMISWTYVSIVKRFIAMNACQQLHVKSVRKLLASTVRLLVPANNATEHLAASAHQYCNAHVARVSGALPAIPWCTAVCVKAVRLTVLDVVVRILWSRSVTFVMKPFVQSVERAHSAIIAERCTVTYVSLHCMK